MKIKLLNGRAIVLDKEIYTICVNKALDFIIESDIMYGNLYAICIINGVRNTFAIKEGVLSIEPKYLSSGELRIIFQQIKAGNKLNEWICESVTLREAEGEYEIIPEISEIRKEMEIMRKEVTQAMEYFKGICEGYNII